LTPVEILTEVDQFDLQSYYQESKFYIGAKRYEHFGLTLLEAAAAGCLPFVRDLGGQTEIIKPKVLRFRSDAELVQNVRSISANPRLRHSTFRDLNKGIEQCDIQEFYRNMERLLKPLLRPG
jgi:glycosyltransferase involved in cell wall biosynthesis